MWPFKKKPKCKHLKKFGEKALSNMQEIVRFSPYEKDTIGYGVSECVECGKRSFSIIGLHMMGPETTKVIDDFIAWKIPQTEFKVFINKHMAWSKWR